MFTLTECRAEFLRISWIDQISVRFTILTSSIVNYPSINNPSMRCPPFLPRSFPTLLSTHLTYPLSSFYRLINILVSNLEKIQTAQDFKLKNHPLCFPPVSSFHSDQPIPIQLLPFRTSSPFNYLQNAYEVPLRIVHVAIQSAAPYLIAFTVIHHQMYHHRMELKIFVRIITVIYRFIRVLDSGVMEVEVDVLWGDVAHEVE